MVATLAKINRPMDARAALMTLTVTEYKHIQMDERGSAFIMGSTMKVVELVTSHLAEGWGADDLHEQYPHLSLGQIYSALAYSWDHKEIIDAEINRQLEYAETLRQQSPPSPISNRMIEHGN